MSKDPKRTNRGKSGSGGIAGMPGQSNGKQHQSSGSGGIGGSKDTHGSGQNRGASGRSHHDLKGSNGAFGSSGRGQTQGGFGRSRQDPQAPRGGTNSQGGQLGTAERSGRSGANSYRGQRSVYQPKARSKTPPPLPKKQKDVKYTPELRKWQKGGRNGDLLPPIQCLWKDLHGRPAAWRQAKVHASKPQVRGLVRRRGEKNRANYGLWADDGLLKDSPKKWKDSHELLPKGYKRGKGQSEEEKKEWGNSKDAGCNLQ